MNGTIELKILFRADASVQQGTGHIMRCLVIADELRKRGHECIFLNFSLSLIWVVLVGKVRYDRPQRQGSA